MNIKNPFQSHISFVPGPVLLLCALLLSTGCRQMEGNRNRAEVEPEGALSQVDTSLHKSRVLTEPAGFPSGIEGPAVDAQGILYAVNFERPGTIGKVDDRGNASLFVDLPEGSVGNGIRFNSRGDMLIADYTKHNILKVDMATKEVSVLAHDHRMFQPNDLAIMDNDILLLSDPDWANSKGQIWRVDPQGNFSLLEGDMGTTNGIEVSPDNGTLYVNESVQRTIWAYDLSPQGDISNKRPLIKFEDFGLDGMRCDADGNLYVTRYGKGTVAVVSPQGRLIGEIQLKGKKASNVAFGGADGTQVFVTLQDEGNIETFRVERPGRAHQMHRTRARQRP